MTATTFDSLGYFEKLKAAGVPEQQARAHAELQREFIEDRLTAKRDLVEMESRQREHLDIRLRELEYRIKADLTKWFAGALAAQAAVIAALVKLL